MRKLSLRFAFAFAFAFASRSLTAFAAGLVGLIVALAPGRANATISINTSTADDWKITNGTISIDWNSTTGHIFGVHLAGHSDNLVDTTTTQSDQPKGLYMDNAGTSLGTGTGTAGFHQNGNHYLDWWITTPSSSSNAFTYTQHFIIADNDAGIHVYFVAQHSATDIAGDLQQVQYAFRVSKTLFTSTYSVDAALANLGGTTIALPSPTVLGNTDAGRQVQDATLDLHGLTIPSGFGREFYTKYDYSTYEYLHRAHGVFGTTFAAWTVIPREDSMAGGPTKQNLIFTQNILMIEALSKHLDNGMVYTPPQGVASTRLFGPFYVHINTFDSSHTTAQSLYTDALSASANLDTFYDGEGVLAQNGYIASTKRGTVSSTITGGGGNTNQAWVVLGDQKTDFEYSSTGPQYFGSADSSGHTTLSPVVPGTYRLSAYVLGSWGELRQDGVTVTAGATTSPSFKLTPENFGSGAPVWTIGTPDRSAHEFHHGHTSAGADDREYWGAWDYWNDFADNKGAVIYFATAVGSTPATANLDQWNYTHWHSFDPGLFGGEFSSSDDTTDGYTFLCPAYAGDCTTATTPPWQIHFATTAQQQKGGSFVVLSIGLAATEASLTITLNGKSMSWPGAKVKASDAAVRSGLSGTYQWLVVQWPVSQLSATGSDNVITLSPSASQGVMYDALRLEIASRSAAPSSTGWNDYEYVDSSGYVPANDAVANNGH